MRSADGQRPSTDRRNSAERGSPSYSAEQRETVQRGLGILARIIARSRLLRQASRSTAARPPAEDEDGD